jgi:hypothetical protein
VFKDANNCIAMSIMICIPDNIGNNIKDGKKKESCRWRRRQENKHIYLVIKSERRRRRRRATPRWEYNIKRDHREIER